jgi:hypothetical protein
MPGQFRVNRWDFLQKDMHLKVAGRLGGRRGTTQYLHPRHLIQETSCGSHDDAWALGYLVCECLGAEHPWFALARQLDAVLADPIRLLLLQHFCATHAVRAEHPCMHACMSESMHVSGCVSMCQPVPRRRAPCMHAE